MEFFLRNLLTGNGINCQFDKESYTSKQLVLRILKNCADADFPTNIIVDQPYLLKNYLGKLFLFSREIIRGEYDQYAFGSAEKESLASFKERYRSNLRLLKMTDICFEDYYLIHDLVCHKNRINNPDQYIIREAMRTAYLYAIYNKGRINELYLQYPEHFIRYLKSFDNIFTTNYDLNIENAIQNSVIHLHGQFNVFSDVYDANSLRNLLPDAPIRSAEIDPAFHYLYSNAITTHSGGYKEFIIKQSSTANKCVEGFASAYKTNTGIKEQVDSWIHSSNTLLVNFGYAVIIKARNPNAQFTERYEFDKFKHMLGDLDILGISPWNDFHLFDAINKSKISRCTYYYYDESNCLQVQKLLPHLYESGRLCFQSARKIWGEYY